MEMEMILFSPAAAVFYQLLSLVATVDRSNFKTCEQSSFCKRNRNVQVEESPYFLNSTSVKVLGDEVLEAVVQNRLQPSSALLLRVSSLKEGVLRVYLNEIDGKRERFRPLMALNGDPQFQKFKNHLVEQSNVTLWTADDNKITIIFQPLRLDAYSRGELVLSLNANGLLQFENYRSRPSETKDETSSVWRRFLALFRWPWRKQLPTSTGGAGAKTRSSPSVSSSSVSSLQNVPEPEPDDVPEANEELAASDTAESGKDEEGLWDEHFKSHHDSKPYGPSAVGLDVSFVGFEHIYGIPEHADSFALESTKNGEPYRLYNLDVFEYELNSPMALYGAVPYVVGHRASRTVGALWLNAAETWIDVRSSTGDQGVLASLASKLGGAQAAPTMSTHWISESGVIELFLLLGPKPADVFRQYGQLTGVLPLPPLFAIAYHQCRWNYNDADDVINVDAGFDEHDIPYDVIWLDIEHTDGKRYFTWDPHKFPDSKAMLNQIAVKGRQMVAIIDPHIKKDDGYKVYKEAKDSNLFVKSKDGITDYDGWCWPGSSTYLDFLNPAVQDYWAKHFQLQNYEGSTETLWVWNDMNEPSVFNGPEITMHKDARHFGGLEHRDIHNIYGFLNPPILLALPAGRRFEPNAVDAFVPILSIGGSQQIS